MGTLQVSIFVRKGVYAILMTRGGTRVTLKVEKIKNTKIAESIYSSMLFTIREALLLVRNYFEEHKDSCEVVIELNNITIQKWFDNCYAKDEYQEYFIDVMNLLQEIPMKYSVVVVKKPKASIYADNKYITSKLKMSSLEI